MPKFGKASTTNLKQAHPLLQKLFNAVILEFDCTILDAQRGQADQEKAFKNGFTKAHYGKSPHNFTPAVALDVIPYPFNYKSDWNNIQRFRDMAAVVKKKAAELGIKTTWGGDWKSIKDFDHFELADWKQLVATGAVKPYHGDD